MECLYCNFELPSNAKFCPKCRSQVICLDCNEILYKDSPICISCGKELKDSYHTKNSAVNNIEFTENEKGKTFRASFTDTVAGNVVETFAQLLPFKNYNSTKAIYQSYDSNIQKTIEDVDIVEASKPSLVHPIHAPIVDENEDLVILEKIFKNKNGVISIYDRRKIKNKGKGDFVAKVTLLFLYYKKQLGFDKVDREELNNLLKSENLYDANFRGWIANSRNLINSDSINLELCPEGEENAQKYLKESLDPSIISSWNLTSNSKRNNLGNKASVQKSNTTTAIDTSNLTEGDYPTLNDLVIKDYPKGEPEWILCYAFYSSSFGSTTFTRENILDRYKENNRATDTRRKNIRQNLASCIKKDWIKSINDTEFVVKVEGSNYAKQIICGNSQGKERKIGKRKNKAEQTDE